MKISGSHEGVYVNFVHTIQDLLVSGSPRVGISSGRDLLVSHRTLVAVIDIVDIYCKVL